MTAVASPQSPTSQMLKATAPAWTPVPGLGPALEVKAARKGRSRRKSGRESLEHRMGAAPRGPGLARSGGAAPGARKPASPRSGRRGLAGFGGRGASAMGCRGASLPPT